MPRPKTCLCAGIRFSPDVVYFKPQGVPLRALAVVTLSIEEFESYRLRYVNDMEQQDAARTMGTSQSTYQRILHSACKKIADALVNGRAIQIIRHE